MGDAAILADFKAAMGTVLADEAGDGISALDVGYQLGQCVWSLLRRVSGWRVSGWRAPGELGKCDQAGSAIMAASVAIGTHVSAPVAGINVGEGTTDIIFFRGSQHV